MALQRLNEVNSGGLSSYSLTNMVIAHLQEEMKVRCAARLQACVCVCAGTSGIRKYHGAHADVLCPYRHWATLS